MQLKNSVLVAALSASSTAALAVTPTYTKDYKLNAYWGQSGPSTDFLGTYCESDSIDFVTLGFVNNSPENGNGTGYPGTNFAAHCAAEVYVNNDRKSKLLSSCSFIKDDIKKCQRLGKKVLLSVGGVYSASSNYSLSSVQAGEDFADFLYKAFGPYKEGYSGPRPLDPSSTEHTTLDGFDFDIEYKFDNQQPYVRMVKHLRELIQADRQDMILTAAPQCPQTDRYFQMKTILQQAKFDKIWIQFYNNPSCEATTTGFNYNAWASFIDGGVNDATELFIGLPGSAAAVGLLGTGYITHDQAKNLICAYKNKPNFGGAMLWDAYYAAQNTNLKGEGYQETIAKALRCGGCTGDVCKPDSTTSTTITTSTTTSTSSSSTSTTTSTTTSSSTSSTTSTTTSSATSSTTSSTTSSSTSSSTSSTVSSTSTSSSSSSTTTSSSTSTSSSTITTTFSSSSYSATTTSSTSTSSEEDDCPPEETSSSYIESSTSSTSDSYPTATITSIPYPTGGNSSVTSYTTSTVMRTTTYTVTSCAPTVTNCPGKEGDVVTETIPWYTTVCPVTETQKPTVTKAPVVSTVYSTRVSTITKCPPSVPNCPVGSVTTETIAISSTVVPAESKPTAVPTYPVGNGNGNQYESSPSKPVQAAAVPSYPAGESSSSSSYSATTMTVAVYPTGKNGTVSAYSTGTGYPVKPTTTTTSTGSGYTAVVCNGKDCSAAYPTASVVTAGSAKAASLSLGLLAVVAFAL